MAITLQFGSTVVDLPTSADSPDWSLGITQAFQAIASTLNSVAGAYDVPAQSFNINASNPGVPNTDIPALSFPTTNVRAINLIYSVFRTTSTNTAYETGTIIACYSPANASGMQWEMSQDKLGDALIAFNITDLGQVQYTCSTLSGSNHFGVITFQAKAILQS